MTRRHVIQLPFLGALAIVLLSAYNAHRIDKDRHAIADIQDAAMREAGWRHAIKMRIGELERQVPDLQRELAAARAAKADVIVTTRTVTKPETFLVPCSFTPPNEPGSGPAAASSPSPVPHLPVDVTVDAQSAVAVLADGRIEWTSKLFATLGWGKYEPPCDPGEPCERRQLQPLTDTLAADSDLGRAWAAWRNRPPRVAIGFRPVSQWRAGWVAGAGLSYDPFAQRLAPAVFVGWGISF